MRTPGKIRNMAEFAQVSGISRPTVSKYFHDPKSVRASTRERIEDALDRFDYQPNIYAMNQNRRLTKNVGIVVPYLADPFFAELARKLERDAIGAGFSPILFSAHGQTALENGILDTLRAIRPAGVLFAPLGRSSDRCAVDKFCSAVPTVLFDSNLEGLGAAYIGANYQQGVDEMVEYLCRTGDPPCFFEMETPANPNAHRRRIGYQDSMRRRGFEPRVIRATGTGWDFERIGKEAGLRAFAERAFDTDTVLCGNDRLAIGLLAAAYEKGLRVGRGQGCALRIAGHDDHPLSRFSCPALTTVSQDLDAIAGQAVATLIDLVDAGRAQDERPSILFDSRLVIRDSA